jgi:hypothetical protein
MMLTGSCLYVERSLTRLINSICQSSIRGELGEPARKIARSYNVSHSR